MDRKEFTKRALMASAIAAAAPITGWTEPPGSPHRKKLQAKGTTAKEPATPGLPGDPMPSFEPLFNGKDLSGFVDVNTSPETWYVEDGILKATGYPIGVMRTEKQYQNFILDIEWRHMEPGGNSGVFVWSDGTPHKNNPYPRGMEVQMLDTQWADINDRPIEYVHGHLFPAMGLPGTIPDNKSQIEGRSKALENRVNPTGEWNRYIVACVDGTIKLSVNGKFVNGIRSTERKKGYICPESEGAEVHFRKMEIMELPGSVITPDEVAPVVENA